MRGLYGLGGGLSKNKAVATDPPFRTGPLRIVLDVETQHGLRRLVTTTGPACSATPPPRDTNRPTGLHNRPTAR